MTSEPSDGTAKVPDENLCGTLSGRISFLVSAMGGLTEAAKQVGVSKTTVQRWRKDASDLSTSNLIKLAEVAGASIEWLAVGKGPWKKGEAPSQVASASVIDTLGNSVDISEFAFIPRYNVKAAAGHGQAVTDEAPMHTMAFRRYWIENHLHANPADLSVLSVRGDSQTGVLNDRDVILMDRSQTSGMAGLYVLRIDGELIVKTLQRLPGGVLKVSSANPAYEPFDVNMAQPPADFAIIGRVVWFARLI